MSLKRRKLRDWVVRRLLTAPAARFELHHIARHGSSKVCDLAPGEGSAEDRAATVERQASDESRDHADAFTGRQQYVVRAVGGAAEQLGEHPFWIAAGGLAEGASALALPTPEQLHAAHGDVYVPIDPQRMPGHELSHAVVQLVSQAQRHNEALMRQLVELSTSHAERDAEIIRSQQQQLDRYEDKRLERHQWTEELLSKKLERDMSHEAHMNQERRKDRLMDKLEKFILPAIMKSAAIKGLLGGATDQQTKDDVADRIRQLFLKLPEETQNQIIAELGEDDGHALLDLFSQGHEKRKPDEGGEVKH